MPGLSGLVSNLRAAALSPKKWWLARQSIVTHGAIQHVDELTRFLCLACDQPPRTVLEIGTAQGGMFWLLCQVSTSDATLISLDLPPPERVSGGLPVEIDLQAMKRPQQTVHSLLGDSHAPATVDRVRALLGSRQLDLMFIDGDHTYDGVRMDYEMYKSLVRPGGFIGFHDITHTIWPECQVDRFWKELAQDKSLQPMAIFGSVPSHFGGIGVVRAR